MDVHSLKFKGVSCFQDEWSDVPSLKPFCLIVGKNNSGKSHYLKFINQLCNEKPFSIRGVQLLAEAILDETSLQRKFQPNSRSSKLRGEGWESHGKLFKNQVAVCDSSSSTTGVNFEESFKPTLYPNGTPLDEEQIQERLRRIESMFLDADHTLHSRTYRQLLADRDIQPEKADNTMYLAPNGDGATNIIRRFLTSSDNIRFPRDLIKSEMLSALNSIFADDGHFTEISIQHKDGDHAGTPKDLWEIYLGQNDKGLIALSDSGSSLKTIFLVLLNLLVVPKIESNSNNWKYVYAFEELENNLHPSLLRRLLSYLEEHTNTDPPHLTHSHPVFFLTTHSNVALDYFAGQEHAQIIHISHNGKAAKATAISQERDHLNVIRSLGSKPSDLLQANGVVWVEGPSDRIYLNKWIELWSRDTLQEGRDYQIMFYGGGLLANIGFQYRDDKEDELINLITINPNVIVVTDCDKKTKHSHLKDRVRRIRDEFAKLDKETTFHWLLKAREIENYLTGDLINYWLTKKMDPPINPEQFESFFPKQGETDYLESKANRKSCDKTELAITTTQNMHIKHFEDRFDLDESMQKIVSVINKWNF